MRERELRGDPQSFMNLFQELVEYVERQSADEIHRLATAKLRAR
jgi:hypothetical protein